ncbi:hypothetical protein BS78_K149500 [Paspalum vaginatum]|uniref:Uncharacterized protein n=1 Tax=Paspalum vaginatum TaxID=158149 RepID=A0A9W7XC48_9POAL|nr:hypothetical protein BS78_K149500 [Paspalum vaginatum]
MDRGGGHATGLNRLGKSCRLRWVNYLHPGLKHGRMSPQEESLVIKLHARWGNRWSRIARFLPGRTDNEIKNYWRTHMRKKAQERDMGLLSPSAASPTMPYQSPCLLLADTSPDNGIGRGDTTHNNNACSCLTRTLIRSTHQTVIDGLPMDQILLKEVNTTPAFLGIQEPKDKAFSSSIPYSPPTTEI